MILCGLPTLFVVLLLKEARVPLPVPADLLMGGAAARAATGQESLFAVLVTLELALLGGMTQYWLTRGPGQQMLQRMGRYVGLTPVRLERAARTLHKGGVLAVALGVLAAGIFFTGLVVGDSLMVGVHVVLGYAGGANLTALAHLQHRAVGPLLGGVVLVLVLAGLGGWVLLRRRQPHEQAGLGAAVQAWEGATCPLCLVCWPFKLSVRLTISLCGTDALHGEHNRLRRGRQARQSKASLHLSSAPVHVAD